jgi:hypothetical protein
MLLEEVLRESVEREFRFCPRNRFSGNQLREGSLAGPGTSSQEIC